MHSIYQRINNLSALLSTCLLVLLGAIALSSTVFSPQISGQLAVYRIEVQKGESSHLNPLTPGQRKKQDIGRLRFNLTADLTTLFHWNTKQLFLYLDAEYINKDGIKNEVVVWDHIVRSKKNAILRVKNQKQKYMIKDVSLSLEGATPVNYTLKYNLMPYVGMLQYGEVTRTGEPMPFPPVKDRL